MRRDPGRTIDDREFLNRLTGRGVSADDAKGYLKGFVTEEPGLIKWATREPGDTAYMWARRGEDGVMRLGDWATLQSRATPSQCGVLPDGRVLVEVRFTKRLDGALGVAAPMKGNPAIGIGSEGGASQFLAPGLKIAVEVVGPVGRGGGGIR